MSMNKFNSLNNSMDTFSIRFTELTNKELEKFNIKNQTQKPIYSVHNESNIFIGIIAFDSHISELWEFISNGSIQINSIEMNQINDFLKWATDLNIKEMC